MANADAGKAQRPNDFVFLEAVIFWERVDVVDHWPLLVFSAKGN